MGSITSFHCNRKKIEPGVEITVRLSLLGRHIFYFNLTNNEDKLI